MKKLFPGPDRVRLVADVRTYIQELRLRFPDIDTIVEDEVKKLTEKGHDEKRHDKHEPDDDREKNKYILAALLAKALCEVRSGKKEIGWRSLNKAKQIEIMSMHKKEELLGLAEKFYNEADKISENRQKAVRGILSYMREKSTKDAEPHKPRIEIPDIDKLRTDVFTVAKIIGEHYDNEGFKVLIRADSFTMFSYILITLLIVIPVCSSLGYLFLDTTTKVSQSNIATNILSELFSIEILGALGAVFSVVISYTRSTFKGTIPQQKLIFATTRLRPLIGAASALALYILIKAGLVAGENYSNALYALAFVSGFSERFIVSKLENIVTPK